jgi:hypothetical protein
MTMQYDELIARLDMAAKICLLTEASFATLRPGRRWATVPAAGR